MPFTLTGSGMIWGNSVATRLNPYADAGAQRYQRKHVGGAVSDRRPPALEERQPAPQDHRRGKRQLNPRQPPFSEQQYVVLCLLNRLVLLSSWAAAGSR